MLVKCVGFVLINLVKWFQKEFAHYVLFSCHPNSRSKIRHPKKQFLRAHTNVSTKINMFRRIRKYYMIMLASAITLGIMSEKLNWNEFTNNVCYKIQQIESKLNSLLIQYFVLNFELYSKLLSWTIWMWWFQYNTFFSISRRATCSFRWYSFPRIEWK